MDNKYYSGHNEFNNDIIYLFLNSKTDCTVIDIYIKNNNKLIRLI